MLRSSFKEGDQGVLICILTRICYSYQSFLTKVAGVSSNKKRMPFLYKYDADSTVSRLKCFKSIIVLSICRTDNERGFDFFFFPNKHLNSVRIVNETKTAFHTFASGLEIMDITGTDKRPRV